jgi:hypothetical protein
LRIVGHQPEPKLIASKQRTKAARSSRSPSSSSVFGLGGAGSAAVSSAAYAGTRVSSISTDPRPLDHPSCGIPDALAYVLWLAGRHRLTVAGILRQ